MFGYLNFLLYICISLTKKVYKIMIKAEREDLERELWLRQREDFVWETRDGSKIPLKEMKTEHIVNAMNYLDRVDRKSVV